MLLGLSEVTKPEPLRHGGGLWFALEDAQLHIGVDQDFHPGAKAHPGLAVGTADQLAVIAVRLRAAGFPADEDDRVEGVVRFFTADPFGNRLEIRAPRPRVTARRSALGRSRRVPSRRRS